MRLILSLAASLCVFTAAPAFAESGPVNAKEFTVEVDHTDLDLTTRKGIARLDERLRSHVRRLCRNGGRDRASIDLERACRESALASTKAEVRLAINTAMTRRIRLAAQPKATKGA